jgi:hypothetical protein
VDNRILRNSFISGGLFGAFLGLLSLNWLIFINFQRVLMSYPLDFIEHAEPRLTWKVIPNGLLVTLGDGTEERFVVNGRKAWAKAINGQLKDRKKQTSLQ